MPELPEVQTVVNTLRPSLLGRKISAARLLRGDILHPRGTCLEPCLLSRAITDIRRRGKKILIVLSPSPLRRPVASSLPSVLCIHLGMTGRLTLEDPASPLLPHTHLVVDLADHVDEDRSALAPALRARDEKIRGASSLAPALRGEDRVRGLAGSVPRVPSNPPPNLQLRFRDPRRFGRISLLACCEDATRDLGPEPLDITPLDLAARLSRTRRAIKTALLDQRLLSGLGNIYADEALFAAGIHPQNPANRLTIVQVRLLTQCIKRILRRAIRSRGSSFRDYVDANGRAGSFQLFHRVYAREGLPCPTCQTPIRRIILSARSAHFCPHCQPKKRA